MRTGQYDVAGIVSRELKRQHFDGLYNPCRGCKGCSLDSIQNRECLCASCIGGKLLDAADGLRIVSVADYREAERRRIEEERARKRAERIEAKRLKAIERARIKKERAETRAVKREEARVRRLERRRVRREHINRIKAAFLRVLNVIAERLKKWGEAIGRAVKTSIICRFLVGVSSGSVLLSIASLVAFHYLKSDWMLHASAGEVKGALYLFQKLFLFEAVYVFVIVAFTVLLIIARLVDGSWKDDDNLGSSSDEDNNQDDLYLD